LTKPTGWAAYEEAVLLSYPDRSLGDLRGGRIFRRDTKSGDQEEKATQLFHKSRNLSISYIDRARLQSNPGSEPDRSEIS